MKKLLYLDTETTGLDPKKHGLIQVAAIVVMDGQEKERINLKINTGTYPHLILFEEKALEINGETMESIASYPHCEDQLLSFRDAISSHLDTDIDEKFQIIGYNINFDTAFMKVWFEDAGLEYSDYFTYRDIDVLALVRHMQLWGMIDTEDAKLETLCAHYGIELDAHDALSDIVATRELYNRLISELINMDIQGYLAAEEEI